MTRVHEFTRGRVFRDRNNDLWRVSNRDTLYRILRTGDRISGTTATRRYYVEQTVGPLVSADAETERLSR